MKKLLSTLLIVFFSVSFFYAQNNDADIESLKRKIKKSNKKIEHKRKKDRWRTWAQRGEIFLKAYKVNSKHLFKGLAASQIPLLGITQNNTQPYYGKPKEITTENDFTVYNYEKVKIFINKEGKVDHWEELKPLDTNALDKAYKAYMKAIELDDKDRFINRNSTKKEIAKLREYLMNRAVDKYYNGKPKAALTDLENSIELFDYPRTEGDTLVKIGAYYYFAGIFAYNSKELEKSKKYFKKSIDNENQIGTCYQYISQILYEQGDTTKAVKMLEEGANKYPNEPKIIYSLIDYYTPLGKYDEAFKYINKAIQMTPDNSVLYIVKGNAYKKIYKDFESQYFSLIEQADSLDKAEFKFRNKPEKVKKIKEEKENILKNDVPPAEKNMNEYADNTVKFYKKGIEKDTANADYLYTLSLFYYNRAKTFKTKSSEIRKLKDIIKKLDNASDDFLNKAKKYGELSLEIKPNDIYTLSLLSRIYYNQGNYEKSKEMKTKIQDLNKE